MVQVWDHASQTGLEQDPARLLWGPRDKSLVPLRFGCIPGFIGCLELFWGCSCASGSLAPEPHFDRLTYGSVLASPWYSLHKKTPPETCATHCGSEETEHHYRRQQHRHHYVRQRELVNHVFRFGLVRATYYMYLLIFLKQLHRLQHRWNDVKHFKLNSNILIKLTLMVELRPMFWAIVSDVRLVKQIIAVMRSR